MPEKTVLIAPLDWGLGHAARCIPIIEELQSYHFKIIIAAAGPVKTMLKQEFPLLTFINLPGYNIKYSKNRQFFTFRLLLQAPKILLSVYKEHQWLKKVVEKYSINVVISDNRFGLYHSTVTSVYITHQLNIQTGNRFSDLFASKIHTWFIRKYTHCWVPDFKGSQNAAGKLSHAATTSDNINYLGCISRFEKEPENYKKTDLLIIISGPEPQRTIFENLLLNQLKNYEGSVVFVRGLPEHTESERADFCNPKVTFKNHLTAKQLNIEILQASVVISRSGYTTVMDLIKLSQPAILVPTPGQAEQEYLAKYLSKQKFFYSVAQEEFNLVNDISEARKATNQIPVFDMTLYKKIIQQFVQSIL